MAIRNYKLWRGKWTFTVEILVSHPLIKLSNLVSTTMGQLCVSHAVMQYDVLRLAIKYSSQKYLTLL